MWIQQRLSRGACMAGVLMFLFMLGVALGDQQIPRLGARLAMPLIVLAVAAAHLLRPRELAMVMTCCWGLALLAFAATLGVSAAYGDVLGGRVEDGVYFLVGQSFEVEVDRLTQRAVIALEAFVFALWLVGFLLLFLLEGVLSRAAGWQGRPARERVQA